MDERKLLIADDSELNRAILVSVLEKNFDILEAADGKAQDIADALYTYQQDQVAFYGNYAEFAQAQTNVENAVIAFKDNTVVMVIASNECTADLDSAVDSALGE